MPIKPAERLKHLPVYLFDDLDAQKEEATQRGIDVIDLGDETCLVVYSTEADPRAMALVIGGGTRGALAELKRQMEADLPVTRGSR